MFVQLSHTKPKIAGLQRHMKYKKRRGLLRFHWQFASINFALPSRRQHNWRSQCANFPHQLGAIELRFARRSPHTHTISATRGWRRATTAAARRRQRRTLIIFIVISLKITAAGAITNITLSGHTSESVCPLH